MKKPQLGWRDFTKSIMRAIFSADKITKMFSHFKEESKISFSKMCCSYKIHILWIIIAYCSLHFIFSIMCAKFRFLMVPGISILIYLQYWWIHWKRAIKKIEDLTLESKVIQDNTKKGRILLILASILITFSQNSIIEICTLSQAFFILESINEMSIFYPTICYFALMILHFHNINDIFKLILPLSLYICIFCSMTFKGVSKIHTLGREAKKQLKMQEMYSSLLNSANDSILIMSQDQKLLFQNEKATKNFEFTPENLHQKFKQISCKPNYESLHDYINRAIYRPSFHRPVICQYSKMKEFGKQAEI